MERWLNGLTVMLEKKRGNIDIEKLRAICLFETDFNWVLSDLRQEDYEER